MKSFYKIDETSYPIVGSGKVIPEGFTEFTVDKNGKYSSIELQDAVGTQKRLEFEAEFRAERNAKISKLDRPLWLASLTSEQRLLVDAYYKDLLDATINWVMPEELVL